MAGSKKYEASALHPIQQLHISPKLRSMESPHRWNTHPVPSSADGLPVFSKRKRLNPYPENDEGALMILNQFKDVCHEAVRACHDINVHQDARNKLEEQLQLSFLGISFAVFSYRSQ